MSDTYGKQSTKSHEARCLKCQGLVALIGNLAQVSMLVRCPSCNTELEVRVNEREGLYVGLPSPKLVEPREPRIQATPRPSPKPKSEASKSDPPPKAEPQVDEAKAEISLLESLCKLVRLHGLQLPSQTTSMTPTHHNSVGGMWTVDCWALDGLPSPLVGVLCYLMDEGHTWRALSLGNLDVSQSGLKPAVYKFGDLGALKAIHEEVLKIVLAKANEHR